MPKPSESEEEDALSGVLGLGSHSARKSHYPELLARLGELEAERNRYRFLFENNVDGIFQAHLHGALRAANPALARMLGYKSADELQKSTADISTLFAGGSAPLYQLLQERGALCAHETCLKRKDGSLLPVSLNLLLRPDEAGLVEGFVADISERVQARGRLQRLNQALEARVAERTAALEQQSRQLQKARDEAEAANRSKSKHLATASHDLLQPLNAARLLISSLLERDLPSAEAHLVQRAHQALESAEDLLSDLLEISKLDQCAVKADIQNVPLAELFASLASEFAPIAESARLKLRVRPCAHWVQTDARLLLRILRNLLSNACRYTEEGGVLLACRKRANLLQLAVWDTGRGIAAEQLEAIFLEFSQLGASHNGRKGVGLGLAIVERIAKVLGTCVKVRSTPARGSLFSLELPPGKPQPSRAASSEALLPELDPLPGQRLLVIDNEPQILHSMGVLLSGWGCEVITAENQAQALSHLNGEAPKAILADYHLEGSETGCTLVRDLRARFGEDIPAIIISADHSDDCRHHLAGLELPLLNKPIKPGKLRALLSQLLRRQAAAPAAVQC